MRTLGQAIRLREIFTEKFPHIPEPDVIYPTYTTTVRKKYMLHVHKLLDDDEKNYLPFHSFNLKRYRESYLEPAWGKYRELIRDDTFKNIFAYHTRVSRPISFNNMRSDGSSYDWAVRRFLCDFPFFNETEVPIGLDNKKIWVIVKKEREKRAKEIISSSYWNNCVRLLIKGLNGELVENPSPLQ